MALSCLVLQSAVSARQAFKNGKGSTVLNKPEKGEDFLLKSSKHLSEGALLHLGASLFSLVRKQLPVRVASQELTKSFTEWVIVLLGVLKSSYISLLFVPRRPRIVD